MSVHSHLRTAFLVALIASSQGAASGSDPRPVVSPDTPVVGKTQAAWSVSWWQWAASFDRELSPVADRTGVRCSAGQDGPVWFLAGVYGSAPVKRTCEVPAGKYLYFPIVNYVTFPRGDADPSCAGLVESMRELTDHAAELTVIVDGVPVHNLAKHRQASDGCFDLGARTGDSVYPSASNGYYVMLQPLPPGKHEIKWGGILPSIRQAVVYEIIVTAPTDVL